MGSTRSRKAPLDLAVGARGARARTLRCVPADDDLPQLPFASEAEWEAWLEHNHGSDGV